ncbi:CPBP family intramembrane glutamic endopeptidase [Polycladomyces subterraneus]|uniref:CPBP family intramembrane metalloprotease n=1 Tax=Polycladomyces subterraneus TaxID=1016997 RepID=A0ABT8IKX8_9BACL|nr:type II CAAX endopeptidase family protein [Polycladomyces subterraneus]MDN4593398.1 CPBP family intramembrane metalloprotease [Polycladomyces subterraneus]
MNVLKLVGKLLLVFLLSMLGIVFFVSLLFPLYPVNRSLMPVILGQNAAFVLAAFLTWIWLEKKPLDELGFAEPSPFRSFLRGAGWGTFGIAVPFVLLLANGLLTVDRFYISSSTVTDFTSALSGFLIIALGEEILVRGYIQTLMVRQWGRIIGIFSASLLFCALHLGNPNLSWLALLNLFLAGVMLGTAKEAFGGLWAPIGFHFTWNLCQEMLSLPVSGLHLIEHPVLFTRETGPAWVTGGRFGLEGGAAVTLLLISLTAVFWLQSRNRTKSDHSHTSGLTR